MREKIENFLGALWEKDGDYHVYSNDFRTITYDGTSDT
ncbi:hypothetical protein GGGNBK_11250 [Sporosarcina sp. ANT_H38]